MSPPTFMRDLTQISFPRVSGDEPAFMSLDSVSMGFSPRERG